MIISRTPMRVSFVGGGTDLPCYYTLQPGAVISTTIKKYVFITINRRFDDTLRISYSQTENVDALEDVSHPLFRESLRYCGLRTGVELTSVADVPSGTGLGSSSCFTVGLVHALEAFQGRYHTAHELAEAACHLEMNVLSEPIGKQDQYAAAFGGLRRYQFNPDDTVYEEPIICSSHARTALFDRVMFLYLGGCRNAREVLTEQSNGGAQKLDLLRRIAGITDEFWSILTHGEHIDDLGELLDEAWACKKRLAGNISNPRIDDYYSRAKAAGATGGKVLGAGMGGFLMLFCHPSRHDEVRDALRDLRPMQFCFEPEGSKIVYYGV
jgi:D-glycero-alpha-D-manno-heptose-7-phosphate kinase